MGKRLKRVLAWFRRQKAARQPEASSPNAKCSLAIPYSTPDMTIFNKATEPPPSYDDHHHSSHQDHPPSYSRTYEPPPYLAIHQPLPYAENHRPPSEVAKAVSLVASLARTLLPLSSHGTASVVRFTTSGLCRLARAVASLPVATDAQRFAEITAKGIAILLRAFREYQPVPGPVQRRDHQPRRSGLEPCDMAFTSAYCTSFAQVLFALPNETCRTVHQEQYPRIVYELGIALLHHNSPVDRWWREWYINALRRAVRLVAVGIAQKETNTNRVKAAESWAEYIHETFQREASPVLDLDDGEIQVDIARPWL